MIRAVKHVGVVDAPNKILLAGVKTHNTSLDKRLKKGDKNKKKLGNFRPETVAAENV